MSRRAFIVPPDAQEQARQYVEAMSQARQLAAQAIELEIEGNTKAAAKARAQAYEWLERARSINPSENAGPKGL